MLLSCQTAPLTAPSACRTCSNRRVTCVEKGPLHSSDSPHPTPRCAIPGAQCQGSLGGRLWRDTAKNNTRGECKGPRVWYNIQYSTVQCHRGGSLWRDTARDSTPQGPGVSKNVQLQLEIFTDIWQTWGAAPAFHPATASIHLALCRRGKRLVWWSAVC
jgi:hypothetical protein